MRADHKILAIGLFVMFTLLITTGVLVSNSNRQELNETPTFKKESIVMLQEFMDEANINKEVSEKVVKQYRENNIGFEITPDMTVYYNESKYTNELKSKDLEEYNKQRSKSDKENLMMFTVAKKDLKPEDIPNQRLLNMYVTKFTHKLISYEVVTN